uniref:Peptidase C1A papain C-terminal domain-containing protein n=1 Tax=Lotharella globosa TaxID=91324 RepID=A0A7S4DMN1_9EUKA
MHRLPSQAFEFVRYNGGLDTEAAYPYEGKDDTCRFSNASVGATVKSQVNITFQDEDELLKAVATAGPVSIAFQVASDFRFYKQGVYDSTVCKSGQKDVNHAVLAVGFDTDEDGKDYWIVKNSWGASWGVDGYFNIVRGKNMCGLADCASYPIV